MGGEGVGDHINSCLDHASNWTCGHDHVLLALERICNNSDSGFATTHKRVLTSEDNLDANLEIRNIRVSQQTGFLVDVTVRHNFKSQAPVTIGRLKASSATPTTRTTSSRAPLPTRSAIIVTHIDAPACGFFAGVHVYLGPHPRRVLALDFLHIQQTGRRESVLFIGTQFSILYTFMYSPA